MSTPLKFLCISRFFKGEAFMEAVHDAGHQVMLLTSSKLKKEAWPWKAISEVFYIDEDRQGRWNMDHVQQGLAHLLRKGKIDRLIAMDDFDVDKVAALREHFRIPGMGQTTSRHFRDKLAMRIMAEESKLPIPAFSSLFTQEGIEEFIKNVDAPWILKPRSAASARGITKVKTEQELWKAIASLKGEWHGYLVEQFRPGQVFHVDGLVSKNKVVFTKCSGYLDTPLEVAQGGGIFRSQTLSDDSTDAKALVKLNTKLLKSFGLQEGAFHSEYIKGEDGKFYFLETSSRVGGAHIAEMVEAATGVNLWQEWANIEIASASSKSYKVPKAKKNNAGIVLSLCRYKRPDDSDFDDKEVVWRLEKDWHIGLILASRSAKKVKDLLVAYSERIAADYHASLPEEKTSYNP